MFPIFGLINSKGEPMVIGFAGKARSGKDTAAKYLCDTLSVSIRRPECLLPSLNPVSIKLNRT